MHSVCTFVFCFGLAMNNVTQIQQFCFTGSGATDFSSSSAVALMNMGKIVNYF